MEDTQTDPLGILAPPQSDHDPLGILKKKANGQSSVNGTSNGSPSKLVSSLYDLANKIKSQPQQPLTKVENTPFNPQTDKATAIDANVVQPTNLPKSDAQEYATKLNTQEAILNTIKKRYEKQGKPFDEKNPTTKNDIQELTDLEKSKDATVVTGKDGKPYLTRGQGFFESLAKGIVNSGIESIDAANLNTIIDPEELANHLNQKRSQEPNTPESAPSGMGTLGANIAGVPKMIGEAAIPVVGEGIMAADAYQTARAKKMEQLYWQGKDEGLSDSDAASKAMKTSLLTAIPDAVTAVALNRLGGSAASSAATNSFRATIKTALKSVPKVSAIFGASELGSQLGEKAAGYDTHDILEKTLDAMGQGALMDLGFNVLKLGGKAAGYMKASAKEMLSNVPKEALNEHLADMGEDGQKIQQELQTYQNARQKIEGLVPEEHIANYAGLIEKQDKIKQTIHDLNMRKLLVPEPLHDKINEQIADNTEQVKAIDSQLEKMSKSSDPSKLERDDLTGQKAGSVTIIKPEDNKLIEATTIAPKEYTPETKQSGVSIILPKQETDVPRVTFSNEVQNKTDNQSNINEEGKIQQPTETKEPAITETTPIEQPTEKGQKVKGTELTEPELTGVTHAETDKVAKQLGLPEYEKNPETVAEWDAEADKRIKGNPDAISELLGKLRKDEHPDKIEQRMMAKYLASLKAKIEGDPTNDKLINDYKTARSLSDKIGGSEVAKSLRARQDLISVEDSVGDLMVREMDTLGVDKLTDKQKEDVVSDYNIMQSAKQETESKLKILQDENAKLKAEAEFKKNTKSTPTTKKSKEDITKVRDSIKESIKDKWNKASNDNTLTAVPVPYAKQLAAIAPDVAKLVKSYIEEGVTDLKEVVKKLVDDIKEYIPEFTERDAHDIIAGEYNEKKKTRNQLAAKYKDLKDEAELINKLERLMNGTEPKDEKAKIERNKNIKELQDKIKSFRKDEAETNKFYGERNKEEEKEYKEASKFYTDENDVDAKKLQKYKELLDRKSVEIKAAINKGEFAPEPKKVIPILEDKELQKKYPKLYKKALDAKDNLIKLKQEREIKFLKQEYANRSKADKAKDALLEAINVPRALMSSFDFSAPLRQGIIPTIAHPKLALKAAGEMFKNAFSQRNFDRYFHDLRETPEFKVMEKSGLYVADPHDHKLSAKEELFMNNLAEKIPVIGKIVAGSERAYVSYLNKMRVDIFQKGADLLAKSGKTPENSLEDYKGLASWVNNSTGRGGMSEKMENASPILNSLFFSPRLIASRLNILGLSDIATGGKGFYSKLPKEIRKMVATDLVEFVGFGMVALAMAKANGANVEIDPRSSDFGKIRVGDTRYDIWGGFQQYIRFIAQMATGKQKSSTSERITELNGKQRFGKTRADVATSFIRGKLAPVPSMLWDFAQGRTAVGAKTTVKDELIDHFTPLIRNDIQDAWKEQGAKSLFTIGLPATFGIGVQTYDSKRAGKSGGAGAGGNYK